MPEPWRRDGVPDAALAAYAAGSCPVHGVALVTSAVQPPGGGGFTPAGWCGSCAAWWHRPYPPASPDGLAVTWDQR
jgi:hypothetical protein